MPRDTTAPPAAFCALPIRLNAVAEGAPVALLPGLFETCAIWEPLLQRHPDLARPLVGLPLPGHDPLGRAPGIAGLQGSRFIDDHARALRQAFPGRKVSLVGHSTGGLVALDMARRHPDLVRDVMLVGTIGSGRLRRFETLAMRILASPLTGPAAAAGLMRLALAGPATFRRATRGVFGSPRATLALPDALRTELAACDPEALRGVLLWLTRSCLLETLPEVRAPVLSIIGRRDPVVPALHQLALLRRLPNARAQLVDAGHLPFLEAPEAFDRSFRYWLTWDGLTRGLSSPAAAAI